MPNPATDRPPETPVNAVGFSRNRDVVQTVADYAFENASRIAAFLVAADHNVAGVAQWLPSNKIADEILNWVRTQPDWSLLRTLEAYDGLNYYVFVNSKNIRPFRNLVHCNAWI
jgi:hypothetical protein